MSEMILTLNCGSSSAKYSVVDSNTFDPLAQGIVERVTIGGSFIKHTSGSTTITTHQECPDHSTAINLIIDTLTHSEYGVITDINEIAAVGHRVVHGGEKFNKSARITPKLIKQVEKVAHLAPLHNPPNLEGILAAQVIFPDIPHVAVFGTAFHQTMPSQAYIYALPRKWYTDHGIRRYGFHGTSHLYVSKRAASILKKSIQELKIITLHIGNGVSICAIDCGISIDTSMGFTPLEGAVMGTRCGDIDPAIPLFKMKKDSLSAEEMDTILNKKSGHLGITGQFTDRRDIVKQAQLGDPLCNLAINIESYRLKKYIGAYTAALGGIDAIVFTAGAGENSPILREKIVENLEFLGIRMDLEKNRHAVGGDQEIDISTIDSKVRVLVIPTNEERVIVEDTIAILKGTYTDHTDFSYNFSD